MPSFLTVLAEEPKVANDTKAIEEEVYVPSDLYDAVRVLKDKVSDEAKKKIRAGEIDPASTHMGLGMWVRNRWCRRPESRLSAYFCANGIYGYDSMSMYIINALFHEIRGEKYDLLEMMRENSKKRPWYHRGIMEGDKYATDRFQAALYSRLDYDEKKNVVSTDLIWNPDDGKIYLVKTNAKPRIASDIEIADLRGDTAHWLYSDSDRRILEEMRKLSKEERLERIKAMREELRLKLDIFPRARDPEGVDKMPDYISDPFNED
jgi:hypothetical protein